MKKILLIRHAESISNAGQKTENHATIPLSEKGRMEAEQLAESLGIIPELIVVSPYVRTRETAEPLIGKYPHVPVEMWDVHEFTYLDPARFAGTTGLDRAPFAKEYWENKNIHHKNGEAETFYEFTKRIESVFEKLRAREENTIVLFSHGRFILAVKFYLEHLKKNNQTSLSEEDIQTLMDMHTEGFMSGKPFPIENISIHEIEL